MTQSVAFAVPLKPGMYDHIHAHMDEIFGGVTAEAGRAHAREDRGITAAKIFHQTEPIDALIVYLEGDDLEHALHPTKHSDHSTSAQWRAFFEQVGQHGTRSSHKLPADLMVDWHAEHGHRHDRKAAGRRKPA